MPLQHCFTPIFPYIFFLQTMERFYEMINDPNLNGATFFAVCRGKVQTDLLIFVGQVLSSLNSL